MNRNPMHSKATVEWGTTSDLVERSRRIMGGIDLDPCSSSVHQITVEATRYYSLSERGEDGLALPWFGRVLCNPPGGLVRDFWRRGLDSEADQIMWMGFSMEQLCVLADEDPGPFDFSCCVLRNRVAFLRDGQPSKSPTHGNYVVGLGVDQEAFAAEFCPLGKIVLGRYAKGFK